MTEITNAQNAQEILDKYQRKEPEREKSDELGQDAFLELFITQLNNQDPLSPVENHEMVAQLAQFSTVEGIDVLNQTANSMADQMRSQQALQASALVGRSVTIPNNDEGVLRPGDVISATAELPARTQNLTLSIESESGELLEQFNLGSHEAGDVSVRWNGLDLEVDGEPFQFSINDLNRVEYYTDNEGNQILDAEGNPILKPYDPGIYSIRLSGTVGSEAETFDTRVSARVDSVTVGTSGNTTLNLAGGRTADVADVERIH